MRGGGAAGGRWGREKGGTGRGTIRSMGGLGKAEKRVSTVEKSWCKASIIGAGLMQVAVSAQARR